MSQDFTEDDVDPSSAVGFANDGSFAEFAQGVIQQQKVKDLCKEQNEAIVRTCISKCTFKCVNFVCFFWTFRRWIIIESSFPFSERASQARDASAFRRKFLCFLNWSLFLNNYCNVVVLRAMLYQIWFHTFCRQLNKRVGGKALKTGMVIKSKKPEVCFQMIFMNIE